MRFTNVLHHQHIQRMVNKHWWIQGKKAILKDKCVDDLEQKGINVVNGVDEFINRKEELVDFSAFGIPPLVTQKDEHHPDFKQVPCWTLKNDKVLVEGLDQAKLLTKTVEISDKLPDRIMTIKNSVSISNQEEKLVKKSILLSCLLEATQEKLPKRKDPLRPMFTFRRDYGIVETRKNDLLGRQLLLLCDKLTPSSNKNVIHNTLVSVPLLAYDKVLQFEQSVEHLVTSAVSLESQNVQVQDTNLPDIGPIHCTISLEPENFYDLRSIMPINKSSRWPHVHTALVHYNATEVKNLFEKEVYETQVIGRSLMKAFSITAAQAQHLYGENVKDLPTPISLQLVHYDGKRFHFCYFQLNTLDIDKEDTVRNYFWNPPRENLYETCAYVAGKPTLQGYNPNVFKTLLAFYKH